VVHERPCSSLRVWTCRRRGSFAIPPAIVLFGIDATLRHRLDWRHEDYTLRSSSPFGMSGLAGQRDALCRNCAVRRLQNRLLAGAWTCRYCSLDCWCEADAFVVIRFAQLKLLLRGRLGLDLSLLMMIVITALQQRQNDL